MSKNLENLINQTIDDYRFNFIVWPDGKIEEYPVFDLLDEYFPGSFNPLHAGHEAIIDCMPTNNRICEFSLSRFDKSYLNNEEYIKIINQFQWKYPIWVNNARSIMDKIGLILISSDVNHPKFHIGYDTAQRLIKYYGHIGIEYVDAHFIVYDRKIKDKISSINNWKTKDRPINFTHGILKDNSYMGLSSTDIRREERFKC